MCQKKGPKLTLDPKPAGGKSVWFRRNSVCTCALTNSNTVVMPSARRASCEQKVAVDLPIQP